MTNTLKSQLVDLEFRITVVEKLGDVKYINNCVYVSNLFIGNATTKKNKINILTAFYFGAKMQSRKMEK